MGKKSLAGRTSSRWPAAALGVGTLAVTVLGALAAPRPQAKSPRPQAKSPRPEAARAAPSGSNPEAFWSRSVEPLLDKKCLKCHAGVRQYGGLDLRSLDTILRGGDHGPAIVPGRPAESRMVQYVLPASGPHMPPDRKRQLTAEEASILRTWVGLLPAARSRAPVSGSSSAWAADYMAEYRRTCLPHRTPPPSLHAEAAIDWFLQSDWRQEGAQPARPSDDPTFVRRAYLDLAGRIPTREERDRFLAQASAGKRKELVDSLLASDEYSRHMRDVFDVALMGRPDRKNAAERERSGWREFLEDAFRTNRPWNDVVRDLIVARAADGPRRGAAWFIAEKNNSHQAIAESVAPIAFGVQIKCAQCHNHPLVWEIEQRHYWGLVAAFNRSKNVKTDHGIAVAEGATGGFINFANLKKESQPATLAFLNGKTVAESVPKPDEKEPDTADLYVIPPGKDGDKAARAAVPKFSRREALADAATKDNPLLARAFVNRMWCLMFGRGIVQPVDQIDSRHHASHPELLEWLSKDFERSGYDVKRLVRQIALSRAYQLDSRPGGKTPPQPETFARALEKPLTAEQLVRSLYVATGNRPVGTSLSEIERAVPAVFPDLLPETYNPSLQQALFLTNSPLVEELLKPAAGNTTAKLLALKSPELQAREAFLSVLGRAPDIAEIRECKSILSSAKGQRGVENLMWALLTCAEFKVNH